jgi:hypothetical protein
MRLTRATVFLCALTIGLTAGAANAGGPPGTCGALPGWSELRQSLIAANNHVNLILNNNMWATIVAADGTVCAVANTGNDDLESQWLLSRVISAQKANTANGLSLRAGEGPNSTFKGLALATANLWKAVQLEAAPTGYSTATRWTPVWRIAAAPRPSARRTILWSGDGSAA